MGDRGNIILRFKGEKASTDIYLYTHWGGSDIGETLKAALKKGEESWDDGPYLGRIIFQQLIGDDNDVTGFGIAPYVSDNEHNFLVVDMDGAQTVTLEDRKTRKPLKTWTFKEFVNQKDSVEV